MKCYSCSVCNRHMSHQGHIEPPKAARGHATFIDGKMVSVTKYRIQNFECIST